MSSKVNECKPLDSGSIEYAEFREIMREKMGERNPDDELSKAFKFFDDDSSGKITVRNLRRIAREMGEDVVGRCRGLHSSTFQLNLSRF